MFREISKHLLLMILCGAFLIEISAQELIQAFDRTLWMEDSFGKEGYRIKMIKQLNFTPAELSDTTNWHSTENSTRDWLGEPDEKCDFGFEISYEYFLQGFAGLSDEEIKDLRPFCDKGVGFGNTKLVLKFDPNGDYKSYSIIHAGG